MKGTLRLMGAAGALMLAATAAPAMAGTTADLLKRLHEKGILTDDEYQELAKGQSAEATQTAAAPAPAVTPDASGGAGFVRMTDSGVGLQIGDVTLKFSGSVNGFYVHDNGDTPSATTTVTGGVATVGGNSSAIRNGLLPGFLKVEASTSLDGWDVGAHFGMYPGINSVSYVGGGANSGGNPRALQTAGIDFRQTYLTFGRAGFGEVKIGRDIGLFQSESILNDITLLSSGTPAGNVAPSNTTLGRIGTGYIYTDFQPQITYTTPNFSGFTASVGIFEPLSSLTGPEESNKQPGFQAKFVYDGKFGDVGTRLWVSGLSQKHDVIAGPDYTGWGWDAGAKVTFGPVTMVGTYYDASGLGTTALNLFDTDGIGNKRDSHGFYLQGLTTFGKFSVGGSYGESNLDYANVADALANPTLVDKNSSWVGQVRYGLNSWVTLLGEYINTRSKAHNGNKATSDAIAAGAILFF
ncbi:porin [Sphingobium limneticum]|uniref:Porin n=1 Tax=Sphingobium limneticum TaxID=1007511 RepID=A0A5J5I690_9SPHN|nr:porin [Sphingobium limneticum]KAA9018728.1 porin [Sphingobium limneticum]KAA9031300.1 porin [Sphingobium limneticum]